ncbi:MAG: DUF4328 domain-containing protein [Planctomycetota bacterium]
MSERPRYKPSESLEWVFCRAMAICLVGSALALVLRGLDLKLLDRLVPGAVLSQAYIGLTDVVWTGLNVVYSCALVIAAVALSWWVARMVRNTEALAGAKIRSASWGWVWFWVPGPNLYRPIDLVSELWTINMIGRDRVRGGSFTRAKVDRQKLVHHKPALVSAWWLAVLAWVILERVGEAMIIYGPTSALGLPVSWGVYAAMAGNVVGVAAAAMGIGVVRRVGTLQREWDERIPKREGASEPDRSLRVSPLRSDAAA